MCRRHNVVAQPEPARFSRIDYFTRQYQFACAFLANYERQDNRGHRRKHAELDFRLTKTRAIRRDNDVARSDEFATAAERGAIDDHDRWFSNLFELPKYRVERVEHLIDRFLDVFLDRNSGAKRPARLIRIEYDRHDLALRRLAQRRQNLAHHRDVQNV